MATGGGDTSFEDEESSEAMAQELSRKRRRRRCFYFRIPCFRSATRSSVVGQIALTVESDKNWWISALKKLRKWSEIVAGPRWKTFLRQFNLSKRGGGRGAGKQKARFQYDPLSYSLNFDDGPRQNRDFDEEYGSCTFSVRFTAIPTLAKSSADLGKNATSSSKLRPTFEFGKRR